MSPNGDILHWTALDVATGTVANQKVLSNTDIERQFVRFNTPESGRSLVRQARANGPVRKLQSNTDSVRTRYISRKMGRALFAESRTVELPAIVLREADQAIHELWPQPFTIDLIVEAPAGGRTRRQHTPDLLLVSEEEGFLVEEWREEKRLLRLAMERPHLFHKDDEGCWHYKPAEEYFAKAGIKYRLRSADELPRIYIANLHFLEDYSKEEAPLVPSEEVARLRALLEQQASIRHVDLIYQHGFTADHIFQMLLMRIGFVDLYEQRMDLTDDLRIFRDETIYRADHLLQAPVIAQLPANAIAIREGSKFIYDGRQMEVVLCGATEVIVRHGEGHTSSLPVPLVHDLFKQNMISAEAATNQVEVAYSLDEVVASKADLQRALARLEALNNPKSAQWSERTMRRLSKRVEGAESVQDKLQLLMSNYPSERAPRIPNEVIALADKAVLEHNKPTKPTIASTYASLVTLCEAAGLMPMSRSTFYEWIKSRENVLAREGRRAKYQKAPIPLTFDYEHPVHGVLPHEIVYIDHTIANVFLKGQSVDDLGKPTLSIAVDGALSMTRALYLSFDPPSANTVLMILRDYVRRHGRLPRTIVLDNGAEFHSVALLKFCSQFGVHIRWRRRSKARDSSLVERSLGATEQEVIANIEGNTLALKNPRNVSPEVQPSRFIKWTLQALHGALEYYLFEHHPSRVHPRFGISPRDYESRMKLERGARSFVIVRYDTLFKLLTSPHAVGKRTRVIDRMRGVFVDGVFYWNDKLSHARKKEQAEVRREMWCARVVYVCFRGEWLIAQARDGGRLDGRFLHEYELARRTENRAKRNLAQRDRTSVRVSRDKTALMIPEIWDARLRDQAMETYYVYQRLGMTEALPEATNTRASVFDLGLPLARHSELIEAIDANESTELAESECYSTETSSVGDGADGEATKLSDDDTTFRNQETKNL
jgi:putative transposase